MPIISCRVPEDTKKAFLAECTRQHVYPAQALSAFIRDFGKLRFAVHAGRIHTRTSEEVAEAMPPVDWDNDPDAQEALKRQEALMRDDGV